MTVYHGPNWKQKINMILVQVVHIKKSMLINSGAVRYMAKLIFITTISNCFYFVTERERVNSTIAYVLQKKKNTPLEMNLTENDHSPI